MKNLILVIVVVVFIGCSSNNEPTPIRESYGLSGFNGVTVNSSVIDNETIIILESFVVYSGSTSIYNGMGVYLDEDLIFFIKDGFYTYTINEVFYNTFTISNGVVKNLEVRTI